jgi:hypothetical protein
MTLEDIYFVKHKGLLKKINLEDIVLLQADKNYVKIITEEADYSVRGTLNGIYELLPAGMFVRINRFQAVGVYYIDTIGKDFITITAGTDRPLGLNKAYESELIRRIFILEVPRPVGLSSKLRSARR